MNNQREEARDVAMTAEYVSVNRVENGWVLTVACAGAHVTLVAKDMAEVTGFLKGLEWQTPRVNYGGSYGGAEVQAARAYPTGSPVPA